MMRCPSPASLAAALSDGYVLLASSDQFLRYGFWRPGLERLHAQVWDELRRIGLRYWSDVSRQILVHPEDLEQAQAVLAQRAHALGAYLAPLSASAPAV